jgi:hypothetical protein
MKSDSSTRRLWDLPFDKPLALLGLLGLVLGGLVLAVILVRGNTLIPPEGDLTKSLTFDLAIGIYYLTLAFYLPQAGFSRRGRLGWLAAALLLTLYGYTVETVQIFRGIDPRFSEASSTADDIAGGLFALVAIGQIVVFAVLAVRFFRMPSRLVVLGIRYAILATFLAFGAGIWMSVVNGRESGDAGNILILHALGFHGLQAIPILAWLQERTGVPQGRRMVHAGGIAWVVACLAVAAHTAAGLAPTELSLALAAAVVLLLVWGAAIATAGYGWLRQGRPFGPPAVAET